MVFLANPLLNAKGALELTIAASLLLSRGIPQSIHRSHFLRIRANLFVKGTTELRAYIELV